MVKTLHLVALPHTQVSQAFCGCAYTAKILKFCKMMGERYTIFLYAPEGPAVPGATLIPCLPEEARTKIFGADDPNRLPAWPTDEQTAYFNARVISEMQQRIHPHDFVLLSAGLTHKSIGERFSQHIVVEPGVGYDGIFTNFCAFESYAWMHHVYAKRGINDGRWFDTVIPNYFDPVDFPHIKSKPGKYLLYLGRLIERKGPHIAAEIASACGMELVVAGAGGVGHNSSLIACDNNYKISGENNLRYVGPVDVAQRAVLLANARALVVPTTYIEPFGGVAIEAMMAGTPAITTDFGAFTETVREGVSGFRFRTLKEAVAAVEKVKYLEPEHVREYAHLNYSLESVAFKFDEWFNRLGTLWDKGWYQR